MTKTFTLGGSIVGSYAGWVCGDHFGLWVSFFISGAGSIVGVYAGWKFARWLERR